MTLIRLVAENLPRELAGLRKVKAYSALILDTGLETSMEGDISALFKNAEKAEDLNKEAYVIVRSFKAGVSNPVAQSLASVLELSDEQVKVDRVIYFENENYEQVLAHQKRLELSWREPAIEDLNVYTLKEWISFHSLRQSIKPRVDDSFKVADPSHWDLEFSDEELAAIRAEEAKQKRGFNRCELELIAQTWSEHCKHKIFSALIDCPDALNSRTDSLFATHIRKPTLEIQEKRPERYLSVFHDNAGVIALDNFRGQATDWAFCVKMETHNSPSAISPYGGASTGIVGVHRDILGTGQGAMPVANWDVLCFESPNHSEARPANALPADTIRSGVIKGIEDGGNQSGIATVQGSVLFDPSYAVKPLVFAGSVGILPKKFVHKKAAVGQVLYCIGGAVGADGLRGAVTSSRDIRSDDFSGSMVQVANAFVQRRVTDFLLEARDAGLIDVISDNGAGGLASSCGELARLSGGAQIDLSHLRLKYRALLAWERLLSESQERMTVATASPEKFEALAKKWQLPFDRLGELNASGRFVVHFDSKSLVDIDLDFLHEACPRLKLSSAWTREKDKAYIENLELKLEAREPQVVNDFPAMLSSIHLCSREGIVRRFDHEVQGRTLRKPFAGRTQHSPQDGSLIEIYEANAYSPELAPSIVLAHALQPQRKDIVENVVCSFDEALRSALVAGLNLESAGGLDNFSWPDPIHNERNLWRLVQANEVLSTLCRSFEIPLVSGKDSMKNNSANFEVIPTLVISIAGSSYSPLCVPSSFFARANDVVFVLPNLKNTLRDSAWERTFSVKSSVARDSLFMSQSSDSLHAELRNTLAELKSRYFKFSSLIQASKIRSAKDVSEGGLLMALFEMCLGRNLGLHLEATPNDADFWLGEGLGGLVFAVDPHMAAKIERELPEASRLGVVMNERKIIFGNRESLSVESLQANYLKLGIEGFWT